jgi:hypothetical protein
MASRRLGPDLGFLPLASDVGALAAHPARRRRSPALLERNIRAAELDADVFTRSAARCLSPPN